MSRLLKLTGAVAHPCANVIFFHGLGGDPLDTHGGGHQTRFLLAFLASGGYPGACSLFGGLPGTYLWLAKHSYASDRPSEEPARALIGRTRPSGRSLILIGHSLGGLVIKHLLRTAEGESHNRSEAANLIQRVKKVAFLATPHTGSGLAVWANRLRMLIYPSAATASLVRNDPNLRGLNAWYREWVSAAGIAHLILAETKPTRVLGIIVRPDSSDPGVAGSL
jgi:pimeloyl-ACP methyl ester carboxylesterase